MLYSTKLLSSLTVNNTLLLMAEKFRKFANAAAAMAVSFSRPNYFESGKKGKFKEWNHSQNLCFYQENWLN